MRKIVLVLTLLAGLSFVSFSQVYNVSFLDLNTNARIYGFGEVGVVSSPFYKNSGVYQNPALISKNIKAAGADFSYLPWLRNIFDEAYLSSLGGFYALDSSNAFAFNFTHFNLGDIRYTDETGTIIEQDNPYELYFKLGYNHSFNKMISAGIAIKYFRSDIVPDSYEDGNDVNSFAVDIGFSYDKKYSLKNNSFLNTGAGISISNFGSKIEYTEDENKQFIPTKLALGLLINPDINIMNKLRLNIELGYQAEKYLTPTPPLTDIDGNITSGYDPNINIFTALYQSFYDAPGGFDEEMNEIMHRFGSELRFSYFDYGYFAFRHGRKIEDETKGNRNYQSFGFGIGLFGFTLDYMFLKSDSNFSNFNNLKAISFGYIFNFEKPFSF